jgi:regulatory protein
MEAQSIMLEANKLFERSSFLRNVMPRQPTAGVITTIAPQAKKRKSLGQRANVFVDGKFSFALDVALIEKYQLARGQAIDAAFLSQLLQEDGDAKARAAALHFLSYRPRSVQEVRARLERDDWPAEVITRVLAQLQTEGFLSDEVFSSLWVENRTLGKPRGARVLRQELRQKGVDRETIEESLPNAEEESENAVVAARALLKSKARAWSALDERARRDKFYQAMQRRGFSFPVAKRAWEQLGEEAEI